VEVPGALLTVALRFIGSTSTSEHAASQAAVKALKILAQALHLGKDSECLKKLKQQLAQCWSSVLQLQDGIASASKDCQEVWYEIFRALEGAQVPLYGSAANLHSASATKVPKVATFSKRQVWWPEGNSFVTLALSKTDLTNIRKSGVSVWAKRRNIDLSRFTERQVHYVHHHSDTN